MIFIFLTATSIYLSEAIKQNPFALHDTNGITQVIHDQFLIFFDTDCVAQKQAKNEDIQQQFLELFQCYKLNKENIDLYPDIVDHWIVVNRQTNCNRNENTNIELYDYCITSTTHDAIITVSSRKSSCKCAARNLEAKLWNLDSLSPEISNGFEFIKCKSNFDPGFDLIVMDSGVNGDHSEFNGITFDRLFDAYPNEDNFDWHGTHVAGTLCGFKYGAFRAKKTNIKLLDVRVLNQFSVGSICGVLNGFGSIITYLQNNNRKAIINLSFGGRGSGWFDKYLQLVRDNGGIMIAAAGNSYPGKDACLFTPASSPNTIAVGSIHQSIDVSWFSNYGECVDIWAPGEDIWSANISGGETVSWGTSMAAPLVAGVVANILTANPSFEFQDIKDVLLDSAQTDIHYVTDDGDMFDNEPRIQGSCKIYDIPCSKKQKKKKQKKKKKSHSAMYDINDKDNEPNMYISEDFDGKYVLHVDLNINLWIFAGVLLWINAMLCCLYHNPLKQWNLSK